MPLLLTPLIIQTMQHLYKDKQLASNLCANPHAKAQCLWRFLPLALVACLVFLASCNKRVATYNENERKAIDSLVMPVKNIDSLTLLQRQFETSGNKLGSIVALRECGKLLRNESRFEEALNMHSLGQQQAEAIGDTLEWVQALNNVGTDYRRIGVLDVAQDYHYRAWLLSNEHSDTTIAAKKNRVMSLNGLGNIYMTLGNFERADSALRLALMGEKQLNSFVGQAINYANLGSIFEQKGNLDSALVYYHKSMEMNTLGHSDLGIALCHMFYGSIHEKRKQYDKAHQEYDEAYQIMKASKDEWHTLDILIALARINHIMHNDTQEMEFLAKAKEIAERIKSTEHLADIHSLYYTHAKETGNYQLALASHELATALQDSVINMEKVNRIQNISLNIERNRQMREIDKARHTLEEERSTRNVGFTLLGLALIMLLGALTAFLYIQRIQRRNHLALKKMAALRETFFTNITHEFRTPLTVILGLSRDMQKDTATNCKDTAKVIERQGEGLLTLINQLLDISKIKSAVGNPDWRNGNIVAFMAMIVESYHDYAQSHKIDLQMFAKDEIVMDFVPGYVVKAINNLLSNAFKFTPAYGKISVLVRSENQQLVVTVADTGKGISKKALERVFEPFYQDNTEMKQVGTGVGLALVKQIMDASKGTITVESEEGKGTTFIIKVPIHNHCTKPLTPNTENCKPLLPHESDNPTDRIGENNECCVLVIEDNKDVASYIGGQFDSRYAVVYAENGQVGLEKALELVPDLIVTDLMMPGLDGLEVCRQVRNSEIISHVPIIITAKITEEARIKGIEAGADAYLAKPFNDNELRTRADKLLQGRKLLQKKFATMSAEFKKDDDAKAPAAKDVDLRFLAKVSSAVYMQISGGKDVDVAIVASLMCMSPRQFYRKINALTGYTPSAYILRLKIKKAKNLLVNNPQMSLGEVADKCGFNDYSNFVRAFKTVAGVTPTNYRRENCP